MVRDTHLTIAGACDCSFIRNGGAGRTAWCVALGRDWCGDGRTAVVYVWG